MFKDYAITEINFSVMAINILLDRKYKMMYNEQKCIYGGFCMLSVIVLEKIAN